MTTLHHLTDLLLIVQLIAFVFFAAAWGLHRVTRQPVERIRLVQTTLLAIIATLVLVLTPIIPHWNLPVLQSKSTQAVESSHAPIQPVAFQPPPQFSQQTAMPQNVPDPKNTMPQPSHNENGSQRTTISVWPQVTGLFSNGRLFVMTVFGTGTLFFLLQWLLGIVRLRGIIQQAVPITNTTFQMQNAELLASNEIDSPFVCRLFKPLIVVPADMGKEAFRRSSSAWRIKRLFYEGESKCC